MPRRFVTVSTLLLFAASASAAETRTSEPITVTATRFPATLAAAGANLTVISEQDIADSGATTVAELLQQQAGVPVQSLTGTGGGRARIDLGGFGDTAEQNTLVLLNGRRLNDVDKSGVNLAMIPLSQVARIEIQHGTGTVLYGDNAVGGVINIITKTGFEGPPAVAAASLGSYMTGELAASVNLRNAETAAVVSVQGLHTDGYRTNNESDNTNLFTEISRQHGAARYGLRAGAGHEALGLPGALNEPQYLVDPRASTRPSDHASEDQQHVELFFNGERLAAELTLRDKNQKSLIFGATEADLTTWSFTPRYTLDAAGQRFVTGFDAYRSRLATHADFGIANNTSDTRRDSLGVYLTDRIEIGKGFGVNLGARRQVVLLDMTNTDLIGGATTGAKQEDWRNAWDATLSWQDAQTRAYLRAAESFRFPVLDEMWNYFFGSITLLRPQTGQHVELGMHHARGAWRVQADAFHIRMKDEIAFDSVLYSNINLDPTQHDGINLSARYGFDRRSFARLGYTYREARFRAGTFDGNTVPEIPRHNLSLTLLWQLHERHQLGLQGNYTGERYFGNDQANAGKQMPDHTLWKLHYAYAAPDWKLRLAIANLTDVSTADLGFYNSFAPNPYFYYPLPERSVTATLEKQF